MDYIKLIECREAYEDTDQGTIKTNIKRLMKLSKIRHSKLCQLLNITLHTSYSYTNKANSNKPELYNLLILASFFQVDTMELFKT